MDEMENEMENEIIIPEELAKVAGGSGPVGKPAKVYSKDGGGVKMYSSVYNGYDPFWIAPDGSEMKVEETLHEVVPLFGRNGAPFYWALYNYRWLVIKDKEVRIEWI